MAFNEELGAEVRRAREGAGLSQVELADALGWSKNMIGRYERGEDTLSTQRLVEIARTLAAPEFRVGALRIVFERDGTARQRVPQQLELEFDADGGVTLRIQPTSAALVITRARPA